MEDLLRRVLKTLGEDPNRPGLHHTPKRWRDAMCFLTSGYHQVLDDVVNGALSPAEGSDLVLMKNIEFYSLCEHHLVPFFGHAHVAYLPGKITIGFSKIPRVVDMFARRLQTQERLTKQIGDALMEIIKPKGVAVVLQAQHLCMMMRGVGKQHAAVTTTRFTGSFRRNAALRKEILLLLRGGKVQREQRGRRA